MKAVIIKSMAWVIMAGICVFLLCLPAEAAVNTGTGHAEVYETSAEAEPETEPETKNETASAAPAPETDGEVYYFDGKKYVISEYWGEHYLTGYGPNEDGSCMTASGNSATAGYTVSSTRANLGKVILIKAVKGTSETENISRYDGVYKCQDTGGPAVEVGLPTTMNTPVVDIFCDTMEEADFVTEHGWITAKIYILREVD